MPNITFSSPVLKKDVTVYAVAGDRRSLLAAAREHNMAIHFECQNGECGSCAVQVTPLDGKGPKGVHLTEKEKTVLLLSGKISRGDIAKMEVDDTAPAWRLACQYMLLDEDILVKF